jgi:hypothetical protein
MPPKSNPRSPDNKERRLVVVSDYEAAIAELYDTLDRSRVVIEVVAPPLNQSTELVSHTDIVITDHPMPAVVIESLEREPVSMWGVGRATEGRPTWHNSTSWGEAINDLSAALTREIGGLRLAPGRGILNSQGAWFVCNALEALLINHPQWTTISPQQRRATRSAIGHHCLGGHVSVISSGAFSKLVVKSEDNAS